jgi:hypothetical protein
MQNTKPAYVNDLSPLQVILLQAADKESGEIVNAIFYVAAVDNDISAMWHIYTKYTKHFSAEEQQVIALLFKKIDEHYTQFVAKHAN